MLASRSSADGSSGQIVFKEVFMSIRDVCKATCLVIAGGLVVGRPLAQAPAADWPALTAKLDHAAMTDNATDLKSARAASLRYVVSPADGVPVTLARYAVGYAAYRLAVNPTLSNAERAAFGEEAETQARQTIATDSTFADAYGLLSAAIGLKIASWASPDAKMTYGPEASAALDHGLSLAPDNPRLLVLQGIGLLRRPEQYGGDPKRAEALFRRALEVFGRETVATPWPNWGRFDAHLWLGQALAQHGDVAAARVEYSKALEIAPDSEYVKQLITALGKG
jgi:tetratricopeptide (TPR) repeat protein